MRPLPLLLTVLASILTTAPAHAGPCEGDIARIKEVAQRSSGPTAPQSIGAQLSRQPTPDSVRRAQDQAQSTLAAIVARAEAADAEGNRAACMQAVGEAKRLLLID